MRTARRLFERDSAAAVVSVRPDGSLKCTRPLVITADCDHNYGEQQRVDAQEREPNRL